MDLLICLKPSFKSDWIWFHHTFLIPECQSDYLVLYPLSNKVGLKALINVSNIWVLHVSIQILSLNHTLSLFTKQMAIGGLLFTFIFSKGILTKIKLINVILYPPNPKVLCRGNNNLSY